MDTQDKKDRREIKRRSTVIHDRLIRLYDKYRPQMGDRLTEAKRQNHIASEAYAAAMKQISSGVVSSPYGKFRHAEDYYNASVIAYQRMKECMDKPEIDRVLLEKHIRKFAHLCTNPYVGVPENDYPRWDLCFDIGPYDLMYKGGAVRVGPFRIKIDMGLCFNWDGSGHFNGFRAFKANEWVYTYQGRLHPHDMQWGSNRICTGEAGRYIWKAVKEGRIMEAVQYAEAVMSTYSSGSNYTDILVFAQKEWKKNENKEKYICRDCGCDLTEGDEMYRCVAGGCDDYFCRECYRTCECCDEVYCADHMCGTTECADCDRTLYDCDEDNIFNCNECGDVVCEECATYCEICQHDYCGEHKMSCDICGEVRCINCTRCIDETDDIVCDNCIEKYEAERAEEKAAEAEPEEVTNE
jgi:hypothetical protein